MDRFVSEEEREAKYNRVLSSSILGLGHLAHITSQKGGADMEELYLNVLRQSKFWKFARNKSPHVGFHKIKLNIVLLECLPFIFSIIP